jgi:hypothetical protein
MGGGEEVDEEEVTDDSGTGFDDVAPAEGVHGHEGLPGAAHNGAAAAVAGVAADVARPRGRGPGRSRTLPASAAGVIGPSPACIPPTGVAGVPAAPRGSQPIWAVTNKSQITHLRLRHTNTKNEIWECSSTAHPPHAILCAQPRSSPACPPHRRSSAIMTPR